MDIVTFFIISSICNLDLQTSTIHSRANIKTDIKFYYLFYTSNHQHIQSKIIFVTDAFPSESKPTFQYTASASSISGG